jgi:hypothetical protein
MDAETNIITPRKFNVDHHNNLHVLVTFLKYIYIIVTKLFLNQHKYNKNN